MKIKFSADEVLSLKNLLEKLIFWDKRTFLRIQIKRNNIGIFGSTPFNCLAFIALPLQEEYAEKDLVISCSDVLNQLNIDNNFEIVGEAGDGQEATDLAKTLKPEVILMDLSMPMLNGIEATKEQVAQYQTPSEAKKTLDNSGIVVNVKNDIEHAAIFRVVKLDNIKRLAVAGQVITA